MKKILSLAILFTLFAGVASAQYGGGEAARQHRTERGFRSGDLTRGERAKLNHNERHYNHEKRRALHDGKLTRHEAKKLHRTKRHNRHQSYRYHHNGRKRVF